ncbi:MAG: hypothetical protein KDC85_24045 [Saprospiraceae bacterium]|nr:hypothetical protein [Lewinella sp.]MCB0654373.1 hypothetical protein [Saprospiraceae bacterium]
MEKVALKPLKAEGMGRLPYPTDPNNKITIDFYVEVSSPSLPISSENLQISFAFFN